MANTRTKIDILKYPCYTTRNKHPNDYKTWDEVVLLNMSTGWFEPVGVVC